MFREDGPEGFEKKYIDKRVPTVDVVSQRVSGMYFGNI